MPILLACTLIFVVLGVFFILIHLLLGSLIRPARPNPEKQSIYECGEPTVGTSWIQFDLRFYVVALLFVVFDVGLVFLFPWGVVFGKLNGLASPSFTLSSSADQTALVKALMPESTNVAQQLSSFQPQAALQMAWLAAAFALFFFGTLLFGYAYLWRRGDLNWVRSTEAESVAAVREVERVEVEMAAAH